MTTDFEARFYEQHGGNPSLQAKRQFYLDQIAQSVVQADLNLPEMRTELRLLGAEVEKLRERAGGQEYTSPHTSSIGKSQSVQPEQR